MPDVRRSWFRFSLRTLLIVVTALCCWLGWESSVVRRRQAMMREYQGKGIVHFTTAGEWAPWWPVNAPPRKAATVPWVRRWLGDVAIQEIWYHQPPPEADQRRLAKVFPEARLHEVLAEPCHPGCFPRGTLVDTPQGPRAIETIRPGESLTAFIASGEPVIAAVQSVFVTENRLWEVETSDGSLLTTQTQPLCRVAAGEHVTADTQIVAAGELQPGDRLLRRQSGALMAAEVLAVSPTQRVATVYNLVLGNSEMFVAGGFLARSKPPAERAEAAPLELPTR